MYTFKQFQKLMKLQKIVLKNKLKLLILKYLRKRPQLQHNKTTNQQLTSGEKTNCQFCKRKCVKRNSHIWKVKGDFCIVLNKRTERVKHYKYFSRWKQHQFYVKQTSGYRHRVETKQKL